MPLSALLSQALLAYTIEFDNEFERRTIEAGDHWGPSLIFWASVIRHVADGDMSLEELARRSVTPVESATVLVGALLRFGLLTLTPPEGGTRSRARRARDLPKDSIVELTERGRWAHELWLGTNEEIESRWSKRFGPSSKALRGALVSVADRIDQDLPDFLDSSIANRPVVNRAMSLRGGARYGPRTTPSAKDLPTWALLSRLLLLFRTEFDDGVGPGLAVSANVLRVLTADGVKVNELHVLTGGSRETINFDQIARWGLAVVVKDPSGRGKVAKLTPAGVGAQERYATLGRDIEQDWSARYGDRLIQKLRSSLEALFAVRDRSGTLRVVEGLVPPEGTMRESGVWWRHMGPDDRAHYAQRERDCVAQSEAWVRDPVGALAHYPLWNPTRALRP